MKSAPPEESNKPDVVKGPKSAVANSSDTGIDQAMEWYILFGLTGKSLRNEQVQELQSANKVKIRGPYTKNDILKYFSNGMINTGTIIYKKGEEVWTPFEKHNVRQTEAAAKVAGEEQVKEWYVLYGVAGKHLETKKVKELYDSKKVKIAGPYYVDDIVQQYRINEINNDTIICRKGDKEWKPLSSQNTQAIVEAVKSAVFEVDEKAVKMTLKKHGIGDKVLRLLLTYKVSLLIIILSACVLYFGGSYFYYRPGMIFDRVKNSVLIISSDDPKDPKKLTPNLETGFIIENSGIVVTNLHAIGKCVHIKVKSGKNISYEIDGIVHVDTADGLAFLKLKEGKDDISIIAKGSSKKLVVGDTIYTISNPGGMEFSLSKGIVSGKRDRKQSGSNITELIQFTAPVSSGSLGGPLLDEKGRLVGIISKGFFDEQNVSFAIPIHQVGDSGKYKEVIFKSLSENPIWRPLDIKNLNTRLYEPPTCGEPSLSSLELYYDEESLVKQSNYLRLWIKFVKTRTYSPYYKIETPETYEDYSLIEIDCKNNKYRNYINDNGTMFGLAQPGICADARYPLRFDPKDFAAREASWKDMDNDEKAQFGELCR